MSRISKEIYSEEKPNRRFKRLFKPGYYYFSYEKIGGPNSPHDFRLQLQKILKIIYKDKIIKDIPDIKEITLKNGSIYNISFDNKELINDLTVKFNGLKFNWSPGIDEQEYGIFEN